MNIDERPRIKDGDVLAEWQTELCKRAWHLNVCDADAREAWKAECVQLLAAVPDPCQRLAWSHHLSLCVLLPQGMPDVIARMMKREILSVENTFPSEEEP